MKKSKIITIVVFIIMAVVIILNIVIKFNIFSKDNVWSKTENQNAIENKSEVMAVQPKSAELQTEGMSELEVAVCKTLGLNSVYYLNDKVETRGLVITANSYKIIDSQESTVYDIGSSWLGSFENDGMKIASHEIDACTNGQNPFNSKFAYICELAKDEQYSGEILYIVSNVSIAEPIEKVKNGYDNIIVGEYI